MNVLDGLPFYAALIHKNTEVHALVMSADCIWGSEPTYSFRNSCFECHCIDLDVIGNRALIELMHGPVSCFLSYTHMTRNGNCATLSIGFFLLSHMLNIDVASNDKVQHTCNSIHAKCYIRHNTTKIKLHNSHFFGGFVHSLLPKCAQASHA